MPMPVTRPIEPGYVTWQPQGQLFRPASPGMALPPSNGVTIPNGGGVLHTVVKPEHIIPGVSKVNPGGPIALAPTAARVP